MAPHTPTPVPGVASTAQKNGVRAMVLTPGQRLYALVLKVWKIRKHLEQHNLSGLPPAETQVCMGRVRTWLDQNPHAGPLAIARFNLAADVRYLTPNNQAGKSLLRELDNLLS